MINKRKKIVIGSVLVTIVLIIGTALFSYSIYSKNTLVREFKDFVQAYKNELTTYLLLDKEDTYKELINQCDTTIENNEIDNIDSLKASLNEFKEELDKTNTDSMNVLLAEIEAIDINELDTKNKEAIISKIDNVKTIINNNEFISASENIETLKTEINEEIKIAAEIKKKREEEEKKKNEEELFNNISGTYIFEKYNKNGVCIQFSDINLTSCANNLLGLSGEHTTVKTAHLTPPISPDELKEDQLGYINARSGALFGELEYEGDYTWSGYIVDDQGDLGGTISDSNNDFSGYIPSIPIEIKIENTNLLITFGDGSILDGTKIFTKDLTANNIIKDPESIKEFESRPRVKDYLPIIDLAAKESGFEKSHSLNLILNVEVTTVDEESYRAYQEYFELVYNEEAINLPYDEEYYRVEFNNNEVCYVGEISNIVYILGGNPAYSSFTEVKNGEFGKGYAILEH